jgi:hypothetical protein
MQKFHQMVFFLQIWPLWSSLLFATSIAFPWRTPSSDEMLEKVKMNVN